VFYVPPTHMGDGFYRSKDPINSIKVLKESYKGKTRNAHIHTQ